MKNHKEILLDEIEKLHELDQPYFDDDDATIYDGNSSPIFEAMEIAAKQAFEAGMSSGYESIAVDPTYPTFEDYLKDINNE